MKVRKETFVQSRPVLPLDLQDRMLADLAMSETAARSILELVVIRASLYVDEGLPLEAALDAMHISRSTYYRRLRAAMSGMAAINHMGEALELLRKAQEKTA